MSCSLIVLLLLVVLLQLAGLDLTRSTRRAIALDSVLELANPSALQIEPIGDLELTLVALPAAPDSPAPAAVPASTQSLPEAEAGEAQVMMGAAASVASNATALSLNTVDAAAAGGASTTNTSAGQPDADGSSNGSGGSGHVLGFVRARNVSLRALAVNRVPLSGELRPSAAAGSDSALVELMQAFVAGRPVRVRAIAG